MLLQNILLFLLFNITNAYIISFNNLGLKYINSTDNINLTFSNDINYSSSIDLIQSSLYKSGTLLTIGLNAFSYEETLKRVILKKINQSDISQIFKIIRLASGEHLLQHKETCMGYDNKNNYLIMVNCDTVSNIIEANIINNTTNVTNLFNV